MKNTFSALLIMILTITALAGERIKTDAEWLKLKHKQLADLNVPSKVKDVGMWSSGDKNADGQYTYYPNGDGRIVFADKTWVLIVSHSIHQEDELGDLTLVRASDGKYYVNKGHVCDKLILETKEEIISLDTFLKTRGKGHKAEPTKWEEYKGEQTASPNGTNRAIGAPSRWMKEK
ncbi:MAG: hypothetical protein GX811_02425 [Lentisphaerae bacterium]|nr:hypothetical protein [Lentisphaerota bacterium]